MQQAFAWAPRFREYFAVKATIKPDDISQLEILEHLTGLPDTLWFCYNPGTDFVSTNAIRQTPADYFATVEGFC